MRLQQLGAYIDKADNNMQTPLWFAIQHGPEAIVEALLDLGHVIMNKMDQENRRHSYGPLNVVI